MSSQTAARTQTAPVEERWRGPLEGWITIFLHLLLLVVMAMAIQRIVRDDRASVLVPLAFGGGAIGLALGKLRVVDLLAHVFAASLGIVLAVVLSAAKYDELNGGFRGSMENLQLRAERLYDALSQGTALPDDLLLTVIGMTVWLVGYSSAWMLFRRYWLGPSVMLPGIVILTSLGLDRDAKAMPLFLYLAIALVLTARHYVFRRQLDWQRERIEAPAGLGPKFLASGLALAVSAVVIGVLLPIQAPDGVLNAVSDQAQERWADVEQRWQDLPMAGRERGPGQYPEFSDTFSIGGPIDLKPEPVALLEADQPSYLAVRRYNVYDGATWSTDVDETFRSDDEGSDTKATRATFIANQPVFLSGDVLTDREPETATITVLRPKDNIAFTIDTHAQMSTSSTVGLGWEKLSDLTIPVASTDIDDVPIDLRALVQLLKEATFIPGNGNEEPRIANASQSGDVETLRAGLLRDYPLDTRIELENGEAVLHVSGRLPVYDDVEVVYADAASSQGASYSVVGQKSNAEADDLRDAPALYPSYIKNRYLQESDTVTLQMRELTGDIVEQAGAKNPFDVAVAIEEHLRSGYAYTLNSPQPPNGRDYVDFFLFDKKRGRCEDFATAMIVMLRSQGIPARLVAGYYKGTYDPALGGYLTLENQAHTWVEVYFPEYGWIPFEPTPSQNQFNYDGEQETPEAPLSTGTPEPQPSPTATLPAVEPEQALPSPVAEALANTDQGGSNDDGPFSGLSWVPFLVTGVTLFAFLVVVGGWLWGLRGLKPGAALYARAMRIGRFWGVREDPTRTPAEYADDFSRSVPGARRAIHLVADLYSAERYGGADSVESRGSTGRRAWQEIRSSVIHWRPWRRKRPKPIAEGDIDQWGAS